MSRVRERRRLLWGLEIVVPLGLLAVWALVSASSTSFYEPPLTRILSTFVHVWFFHGIATNVLVSLKRVLVGYFIAVVVGASLGIVLGMAPTLRRAVTPAIEFSRAIPAPALIPIGITLLGIGDRMKISLIAFVCVFPVLLNTIDGVVGIDPTVTATMKSFRLTRREQVLRVLLPAASPQIFAGMRVSLSIAVIVMVVSEMVASTSGVGFFVLQAQQSFQINDMWAGILMLGILGILLNGIFGLLEGRVLAWHRGARQSLSDQ